MDLDRATVEELIRLAKDIRRGLDQDPKTTFKLAKKLAEKQYLDYARRLAEHIHADPRLEPKTAIEVRQKWALWISKNPDEHEDTRHDAALAILDGVQSIPGGQALADSTDPETLGIAGGITKRLWLADGQRHTLERSLRYYERGAERGILADNGYTAINEAFVRDLLASLEGADVPTARARERRRAVLDTLLPVEDQPAYEGGRPRRDERWFHETIAEAHFGLQEYDRAEERLTSVDWDAVSPWERETTARQFAWLARLFAPDDFDHPAWQVVQRAFGGGLMKGAGSLFAGKLGLALSGGGFRASFFHIGALAGLAELDMLRHVEVLSCVSGGSIVGAHYYLKVRKLLHDEAGDEIERERYIELVEELADEFLAGVTENLRTRVFSNLVANLKMLFVPGYTRTNRLGELYEKHLYGRIDDDKERRLRMLRIHPGADKTFNPKYDNWRRASKVPILVLNATTVNTGHNWQFTASWMGEPPSAIDSEVDGNYRLRRMWLEGEAPPPHSDVRLGQAVAASSCVPGLFTPLELRDLYETEGDAARRRRITVRLVDGGVHDNQGIFGLLDQNCQVVIVSDASGQMGTLDEPGDGPLSVLARSSAIAMARVRVAQFRQLDERRSSGRLRGLLFLHLKDELPVDDKDWIGCDNPKGLSPEALLKARRALTSYGILKPLQARLADVRTDLDSFNEIEADALMASGCKMIRRKFAEAITGFPTSARRHGWPFLRIEPLLSRSTGEDGKRVAKLLDVATHRMFKVWRLSGVLKALAAVIGIVAAGALCWAAFQWGGEPLASAKGLAAAGASLALALLAGTAGLSALVWVLNYRKTIHQILVGLGLGLVGFVASWVHLTLFDRWFLRKGRLPVTRR